MTPRRLDVDVVGNTLDAFEHTGDVLDLAVDVNSHLAGALLGRTPGEYRESFDLAARTGVLETTMAVRLKPSVGMRNVIVPEYVRLGLVCVAAAVPGAIDAYRASVSAVARSLLES